MGGWKQHAVQHSVECVWNGRRGCSGQYSRWTRRGRFLDGQQREFLAFWREQGRSATTWGETLNACNSACFELKSLIWLWRQLLVKIARVGMTVPPCFYLLFSSFLVLGQVAHDSAGRPSDSTMVAVSSSVDSIPSLEELGLPSVPSPTDPQAQSASPKPAGADSPQQAQQGNAPSLGDLGFSTTQTQSNPQQQALLNKRTHMLKVHQTLGLITAVPMALTLISGPQAKAKGKNGQPITEPTSANLDLHIALGGLTTGLYYTTAYYAIFAPKIAGVKPTGAIRLHRDLEWIHGPGMILTPILGIMAYNQEKQGQKPHGLAAAHAPVAYVTALAYGAAIIAVSWPIHWKFWETR